MVETNIEVQINSLDEIADAVYENLIKHREAILRKNRIKYSVTYQGMEQATTFIVDLNKSPRDFKTSLNFLIEKFEEREEYEKCHALQLFNEKIDYEES